MNTMNIPWKLVLVGLAIALAVPTLVALAQEPAPEVKWRTDYNSARKEADAKKLWMHHWMRLGFDALSQMLAPGPFAFGATPTLADVCLIPQLYNARRWGLDLGPWPGLAAIESACLALPAFSLTAPEAQPDAI